MSDKFYEQRRKIKRIHGPVTVGGQAIVYIWIAVSIIIYLVMLGLI